MDTIISAANGSTFLEISKSVFKELEFVLANKQVLDRYDYQVKPIFQKIRANQKNVCSISELRKALLPKLLSGEIAVN
jgi:type I restriction enzyme S subunit